MKAFTTTTYKNIEIKIYKEKNVFKFSINKSFKDDEGDKFMYMSTWLDAIRDAEGCIDLGYYKK
jgi:hypothetical protein